MATIAEQQPEAAPLRRQRQAMTREYPGFTATWYCDELEWVGRIRPHSLACEYRLRIRYRLGKSPEVHVLEPELKRRPEAVVPHLYNEGHLCLFLPFGFEWDPGKLIAETTVPWATLWLHHYEVWRVTGKWMGGGRHPGGRERRWA